MRKLRLLTLLSLLVPLSSCEYTDEIPPVITLQGASSMQVYIDQSYQEPGVYIRDNVDKDITAYTVQPATFPNGVPGTYTLQYSAVDAAGNEGTATRTVTVLPETYEIPTILPGLYDITLTSPGYPYLFPITGTNISVQNQWAGSRTAFVQISPFSWATNALSFFTVGEDIIEFDTNPVQVYYGPNPNDYFYAEVQGGGAIDLQTNSLDLNLYFMPWDTTRSDFFGTFHLQKQ